MKRIFLMMTLMSLVLMLGTTTGFAQGKGKKPEHMQAAEGEDVWVLVNTIKADKRAQFEKYMFEIFLPAFTNKSTTAADRKSLIATRLLVPSQANDDGTYTYIFLMDPVIKDADYQFLPRLTRAYGEAKAREYVQMLEDTIAKPQIRYTQKQGKLNQP